MCVACTAGRARTAEKTSRVAGMPSASTYARTRASPSAGKRSSHNTEPGTLQGTPCTTNSEREFVIMCASVCIARCVPLEYSNPCIQSRRVDLVQLVKVAEHDRGSRRQAVHEADAVDGSLGQRVHDLGYRLGVVVDKVRVWLCSRGSMQHVAHGHGHFPGGDAGGWRQHTLCTMYASFSVYKPRLSGGEARSSDTKYCSEQGTTTTRHETTHQGECQR